MARLGRADGLTLREVEILRLVSAGMTNRQAAERLGLSIRTVDAHLRSIYAKLGIKTRSAATRYAVEHFLA
jgi:DNA-binding CsgD family transcriptional regulator